ncbi:MAG: hypothetical protein AB8G11_12635 [Saprospiraceae bacterium]
MKSKIIRLILILILGNIILYLIGHLSFSKIDFATSVVPGWHTTFIIIPNILLYAIAFLDSILLRIFFRIRKKVRLWNIILLMLISFLLYFTPFQFPQSLLQFLMNLGICILIILSVLILVIDIIKNKAIE